MALASPLIALTALVAGAIWAGTTLYDAIVGNWDKITGFLTGLPSTLVQMGTDIMMGLVNGITGAAGFVKDAINNTVNSAITSAKEALGIALTLEGVALRLASTRAKASPPASRIPRAKRSRPSRAWSRRRT